MCGILSQFQPFQLHPVGANMGKVILCLLRVTPSAAAASVILKPEGSMH